MGQDQLSLVTHPDDRLRLTASLVSTFGGSLEALVQQMLEVMYSEGGVGLAAPQVGFDARLILMDPSEGEDRNELRVMCNPVIVSRSDEVMLSEEGCLSVPGVRGQVLRHVGITLKYHDLCGVEREEHALGLASCITQHELDHLNGILFVDRIKEQRKRT